MFSSANPDYSTNTHRQKEERKQCVWRWQVFVGEGLCAAIENPRDKIGSAAHLILLQAREGKGKKRTGMRFQELVTSHPPPSYSFFPFYWRWINDSCLSPSLSFSLAAQSTIKMKTTTAAREYERERERDVVSRNEKEEGISLRLTSLSKNLSAACHSLSFWSWAADQFFIFISLFRGASKRKRTKR